jgi:hypothetical protein
MLTYEQFLCQIVLAVYVIEITEFFSGGSQRRDAYSPAVAAADCSYRGDCDTHCLRHRRLNHASKLTRQLRNQCGRRNLAGWSGTWCGRKLLSERAVAMAAKVMVNDPSRYTMCAGARRLGAPAVQWLCRISQESGGDRRASGPLHCLPLRLAVFSGPRRPAPTTQAPDWPI